MRGASRGRLAGAVLAGVALAAASACKGRQPTLQEAVEGLSDELGGFLGAKKLPGQYVEEIYAVHEDDRAWRFRTDAEDPLGRASAAVRGLGAADYASWRETGLVVALLAAIADDHPSDLIRAEALDTLTRMGVWTVSAVAPTDRAATEAEGNQALQRIVDAARAPTKDAGAAADVADALNVLSAYRFDQARALPEKVDPQRFARETRLQLVWTRKVLRVLTGGALDGYDADPRVRDALDRALVSTSASTIRLAVAAAAIGAPSETVRGAAVRDMAQAKPDQAARLLGVVLTNDEASSVRREAARALAAFPEKDAVPELLPALADDRFDVRAAAASSLAQVTGQSFGDDRKAWTRWWQERAGAAPAAPRPQDAK